MINEIVRSLVKIVSGEFSLGQKEVLASAGVRILRLDGQSVSDLKSLGVPFWSKWHEGNGFEKEASITGDVGILTPDPFLPQTGNLSLSEHWEAAVSKADELSKSLGFSVKCAIGTAQDYAVLNYLHKKQFGSSIFRIPGKNRLAVTDSMILDGKIPLFVGESYNDSTIISYRKGGSVYSDIYLLPLIIPTNQI